MVVSCRKSEFIYSDGDTEIFSGEGLEVQRISVIIEWSIPFYPSQFITIQNTGLNIRLSIYYHNNPIVSFVQKSIDYNLKRIWNPRSITWELFDLSTELKRYWFTFDSILKQSTEVRLLRKTIQNTTQTQRKSNRYTPIDSVSSLHSVSSPLDF